MSRIERPEQLPHREHQPAAYTGPSRDEVLAMRRAHVAPGVFTYYRSPIQIVEGYKQYLWDEAGRRYLDALGGVATISVGHCHPRLVEAMRRQVGTLVHATTIYLHPNLSLYAKRLAARFSDASGLDTSYFTNSGSEANDLATMVARLHTGHFDVISLRNGYHGGTSTTMGLTAMGNWKFPHPHAFGVKHATPGYCYRCPYGLEYPTCDMKCARDVEQLIDYETCGKVAALIAEPIQGAGGVVDPPPEYFKIVFDIVRAHGGLCIMDEVQTGWGRLGSHFWGHERYDVLPDIVTMAKGIANGAPLGAVTMRRDVAASLSQKLHFSTFGGNPVSMIQALTTLEIIDDEQLQQRAHDVGGYLKQRLIDLQSVHAIMGDVRGAGLLVGVELVRDRVSKEPAAQEAIDVLEGTRERGVLLGRGGVYGNVLRIMPPLCITRDDVDVLIERLDETLASLP